MAMVNTASTSTPSSALGNFLPSPYKTSALYATFAAAQRVRRLLMKAGFAAQTIHIRQATDQENHLDQDNEVINEVLADSALGAALGVGAGALGTVALIATSSTLFVASPLLAPLALMANFASVGGVLGGAYGAADKKILFVDLFSEALSVGNVVLKITTQNTSDNALAQQIIHNSLEDNRVLLDEEI